MKIKKLSKEEIEADMMRFKPMDLNEDSIRAMVERCFATTSDPNSDFISEIIIPENAGFKTQDTPAFLSKSRSEANKQNIKFVFGQLRAVHNGRPNAFPLSDAMLKYDGTKWTGNFSSIANLFYLSKIFGSEIFLTRKTADGSTLVLVNPDSYVPTLSPKDPNFPAWWEAHKAEWEDKQGPVLTKKSGGTEPADN